MRNPESIIHQMETLLSELRLSIANIDEYDRSNEVNSEERTLNEKRKFKGVSGAIFELVSAGFFDTPRFISEIKAKLRDEGINKPTTGLMSPLLRLIKHKVLARKRSEKGIYQYSKRAQ